MNTHVHHLDLSPVQLYYFYLTGKNQRCGISDALINLLRNSINQLRTVLPRPQLSENVLLLFHDGTQACDKQMAYLVAMQQEMKDSYNETFHLRIAFINWYPGEKTSMLHLISNSNLASAFYGNSIEFVALFNNQVLAFSPADEVKPKELVSIRDQIMLSIHRNGIDSSPIIYDPSDPIFTSRLNRFINFGNPANVIITNPLPVQTDLYPFNIFQNRKGFNFPKNSIFFPVPGDATLYIPKPDVLYDHYVKLSRNALLFDFCEKGNDPALLAHISGLKAEKLEDDKYVSGFNRYIEKSYGLMQKMGYSPDFINRERAACVDPRKVRLIRKNLKHYANRFYDIERAHTICLVYQPFIGQGNHLHQFLKQEHPFLLSKERLIRRILSEGAGAILEHASLAKRLEKISGLTISQLQSLYMGA
jgi:hypothetical protein